MGISHWSNDRKLRPWDLSIAMSTSPMTGPIEDAQRD